MNSEQDTLPNLQTVLDAISNLQRETSEQFVELRQEMNERFENMRLEMMSFDARIDRLQAMSHESLNLAYNVRADIKILREEVSAWSKEVRGIQKNFV